MTKTVCSKKLKTDLILIFMVDVNMNDGSSLLSINTTSSNTGTNLSDLTDYEDYNELLSAIFNINFTSLKMDGLDFDYNGTDMNDTLDDYLKRICQRQGPQVRPSGLGASAAGRTSTFGFIIEGVLLSAVSVFGLLGNIVAIIVISRPTMKGSFSSLLIGKLTLKRGMCLEKS